MSSFKIFDIAGSGMNAQNLRLSLVSSNLANVDSISSSIDQTYRARHPVFATQLNQLLDQRNAASGVEIKGVVESGAPLVQEYAPNHPMANENGYIFKPNVNAVEELANMMSASRSYQNNVEALNTAKQLLIQTLRIGQ
ncbi:MAG: flagellar basal body rod protein FlgC [Methylococcaceae bacterium]|nr:flagellar basal body rod protein FlgC [Methylococcaceae bacterium]MCI0666739.1 flagellar basal body rod protein FlgC [Methylococcaceae bacterium]MCI0732867.1 flagellar basal body rod protein FlgC [Methylococcaceae bacterium]